MNYSLDESVKYMYDNAQKGDLILLYGQLGAGKTYWTTIFCSLLGIQKVQSPTFTLVNEYVSIDGKWSVMHTDLYRLKAVDETIIEEIFSTEHINIIEWAEKLNDSLLSIIPSKKIYKIFLTSPVDLVKIEEV